MLPRENRLPSPQIKTVLRRGKRVSAQGVQLIFAQNSLSVSRFAFVVPISVDKRAVGRNRVRRLVREAVRLALPAIAPGWDAVFLVKNVFADEFSAVDKRVREILQKAGLLTGQKVT